MSNLISNIIVIYPGRFQPFAIHHKLLANQVCKDFDGIMDEFLIVTTDKVVEGTSPLTFDEKLRLINKSGFDNVLKVSSPYNCWKDLKKLYDSSTTSVIYIVSDKDKERFDSMSSTRYYIPITKDDVSSRKKALTTLNKGFEENVYMMVVPEIHLKLYDDEELNGTNIRSILGNLNYLGIEDNERHKLFKSMFGYYDTNIEDLLVDKFGGYHLYETKSLNSKSLLTEGGGGGHIQHIFEDDDMSFGEIRNLINTSLTGKLNPTEKVDGMNCLITYKDGECRIARNKTQIMKPINSYELLTYMSNPPHSVVRAYTKCIEQFNNIFSKLDKKILEIIFGENSNKFINIEIIDDRASVEFNYNGKFLVCHNVVEYNIEDGTKVKVYDGIVEKLVELFNNTNISNSYYNIKPPIKPIFNMKDDNSKMIDNLINKLENLMSKFGLNDDDTVSELKRKSYQEFLEEEFTNMNFTYTLENTSLMTKLVERLALNDKKILPLKDIKDNELNNWVSNFEQNKKYSKDKEIIKDLEVLIYELGLSTIKCYNNFLSSDDERTINQIKDRFLKSLDTLGSQPFEPEDVTTKFIRTQFNLDILNGKDEDIFQPTEGLVFNMNNRQYKLTGFFGPIHNVASYYEFNIK